MRFCKKNEKKKYEYLKYEEKILKKKSRCELDKPRVRNGGSEIEMKCVVCTFLMLGFFYLI